MMDKSSYDYNESENYTNSKCSKEISNELSIVNNMFKPFFEDYYIANSDSNKVNPSCSFDDNNYNNGIPRPIGVSNNTSFIPRAASLPTMSSALEPISDNNIVSFSSASFDLYDTVNTKKKSDIRTTQWIKQCLLDDVIRHVHDVARRNMTLNYERGSDCNYEFLKSRSININSISSDNSNNSISTPAKSLKSYEKIFYHSHSFDLLSSTSTDVLRVKSRKKHARLLKHDSMLTAELRSVIVMFINIEMKNTDLYSEKSSNVNNNHKISTCEIDSFYFIPRTKSELQADKILLNRFQTCIKIITSIFLDRGGQLRQFIVDDKGTVCIGTFGLKGSVNYDNAAAAIGIIIIKLNN